MEHFSKSLFWRVMTIALVAGVFYLGYSISRLADTPIAHAEGPVEVHLSQVGNSQYFTALPVKITK